MRPILCWFPFLLLLLHCHQRRYEYSALLAEAVTLPPLPVRPIPSSYQLSWQLGELALFLHFGMNTFTNSEWGTGHADPSLFNPEALDAKQWVRVAADAGFSKVILTAKHHDGFCLWPSAFTNYSIKSSPWRDGKGDVVAQLAAAAREAGIGLGLYLSPWDRHEPVYGRTTEYNEFYLGQMTELLTGYGEIKEVWLDGAKGKGEKNMEYLFEDWFSVIHQLQPSAVIFSDAGPDVRWVGDEAGVSAATCWSPFNTSLAGIGHTDSRYSSGGDPHGRDWVPPECDVSIRPGWFWHHSENPKSAQKLLDIFYKSAGRNCLLLLNVPPNSSGLISEEDISVLNEFAKLRKTIFSNNLAKNAIITASSTRGGKGNRIYNPYHVLEETVYSYWAPEPGQSYFAIYLNFQETVAFNVLQVQEPVQMGQRLINFHLDILHDGQWRRIASGTTVGYRRLLLFPIVKTEKLRFVIDKSKGDPLISYLGLHLDHVSAFPEHERNSSAKLNSSCIQLNMHNQSTYLSKAIM
ncbi:Alpha-L-fucosidase 1 [Nymphaea thermarum]|nr:Alpha-L-fucosidase 1 [Nymphaea thermarum]